MKLRKIWAFTLVELLVVMSIIAMLMAILLPSLGKAREQARRVVCMADLRSIGQSLFLYAHDNDDRLVPGDSRVSWDVWGEVAEYPEGQIPADVKYRQVNLGHLLASGILPMAQDNDHVFFCPSGRTPEGTQCYEGFFQGWGKNDRQASISYMFNNALDGFDGYVQDGQFAVLSHRDKINFLLGDGSVQAFNVKPLVFDRSVGPELLQEVSLRYGVCFPTIMLHRWLERGEVDLDEAKEYLNNPSGWTESNCTASVSKPVLMVNVGKNSLVCDVVGVWNGTGGDPPSPPPG